MKARIAAGLITALFAVNSYASLTPFQTYTGNIGLSTDGFGSDAGVGTLTANAPAGSTVIAAYLYSATYGGDVGTPSVSLGGSPVTFGPRVANPTISSGYLASFRADVTSLVKPVIDAGLGGAYNFSVAELGLGAYTDGEALVVVYQNNSLAVSTIGILDGYSAAGGDSHSISYADPLDVDAPGFFAEMRLGISFSCCSQQSTVKVNGTTITNTAGNYDDGLDLNNGSLFTMGGDNDPYSPFLPAYEQDHERYNLVPYINDGDTNININTNNPSHDDNIFLATFWTSGEAVITAETPEPSSLLLMALGLIGFGATNLRKRSKV